MTQANTVFQVSNLDFNGIKQNFRNWLQSQAQWQDYNFSGSSLDLLLDLLCYNTFYMGYYLNMLANEVFLDSAITQDAIMSRAKELNYVPASRTSAIANVNITVTPPGANTTSTLTLPRFTTFQSEAIDGVNYTFSTNDAYTITKNNISGTFNFNGIQLVQGEYTSTQFTVNLNSPTSLYTIPNANIDTTTLMVSVQNSSSDLSSYTFGQANGITTVTANSRVYFLTPGPQNFYSLAFGDGVIGYPLANGNIITVEYLTSDAALPNYANIFTIMNPLFGFSNVIVSTSNVAAGGSDRETLQETKFRAPRAYVAQNRSVTLFDYEDNLVKNYPYIKQVAAWGGEDNNPPQFGWTFLSINPEPGFIITDTIKQNIVNDLIHNQNVVSINATIVDPSFTYVLINAIVHYDPSLTTLTSGELQLLVTQAIQSYCASNLGNFNSSFKLSRLANAIDTTENSILNSELTVLLQNRLVPVLGFNGNYTFTFGTTFANKSQLLTFPTFQVIDNSGVTRNCYIEEIPNNQSSIVSYQVLNPGGNYTGIPGIEITGDGIGATALAQVVNGRIVAVLPQSLGSGYSIALVNVLGGGGSGAQVVPVLSSRNGTLRLFYYNTDGTKIILNPNQGTIGYDTGVVTLNNFNPVSISPNPYYTAGIIAFNVSPENQTILPVMNNILTLDPNDPLAIQCTCIPSSG